jgi:two-component system cell cycle sensor histidine kinase/response regulator CckA
MLSLNTVISELEKMLCRLVREDIDLRMALAPALGTIEADPGQLEQVLMNLVVNGRDAMPGGGRLTIETANVELTDAYVQWHDGTTIVPGKYVMVAVSDTGTGMTPEVQSRIFEPFFTTKEVGQGTGLGLATVYGIVKQAHGYVWVYSEPGHGTTFKIYLPRIEASEAPAEAPTARRGAVSRGAETILLVEDDQAVRMVARRILACWGYTVLEAVTGAEALLIVERQGSEIDLVLTDMVMPEMSGPELASVLRERHPALRVLFMSGYSRNVLQQKRVFGAGSAYLEKPFTPEGLAAKVREVLDGGSSAD